MLRRIRRRHLNTRGDDRPDAMLPVQRPDRRSPLALPRPTIALVCLCLCGLTAIWSTVAMAEPSRTELLRAEALATEGKAYFKGKLYQQAADKFMESYAIASRPALVFNAARAYEEGQMLKQAIAIFEMYTALADVGEEGKADARARIEKLKTRVALEEKAAKDKRRLEDQQREKQAREREARLRAQGGARDATPSPGSPARGPFPIWRTAGGGALVVLGAVSLALSYAAANEIPPKDVTNRELMTEYLDNAATARAWYGVFIGATAVGAGLIAWGQYDYWLPPPEGKGQVFSALQITPALGPHGPGLQLRLSF